MKRSIIIATFGVLLCTNLFSQNLKIGDFEMPVTKAEKFYIGGNFNLNSNDTLSNFQGDFRLDYSKFYSSLPTSYFLNVFFDGYFQDYTRRQEDVNYTASNYKALKTVIAFDYKKYFSDESGFHFNTSIHSELWYYTDRNELWSWGTNELGIGYGRIIDATSLAKALRIQEFLLSNNQLLGEMDKAIVMEIAQHCDKLYQYEIDFGEKFQEEWFLDLEKIMMKSGKLTTGNLNPFSVLRVIEVLYAETIWYRPVGWSISSNFASEFDMFFHRGGNNDYYGTTVNFDVGYPINNRLHFTHNTSYKYLIGVDYGHEKNSIRTSTSLSYNLTNLLNLNISYLFYYNSFYSWDYKKQDLQASASYYLENNASISIQYNFINYNEPPSYYPFQYTINENKLTIGFNYRFW